MTKRAAIGALRAALNVLEQGNGNDRHPVGEIWRSYFEQHVTQRLVKSGQKMAAYSWNNLRQHFAECSLDEVNQARVNDYERLRAKGVIGQPAKAVTVRREILYLLAAIRYCVRQRIVSADDVRAITLPSVPLVRKRHLTIEEVQHLLAAAARGRGLDGRLTKPERFIWIALETGARKSAILDLTWHRVDFENGLIDFQEPGRPVTKKRRTTVPMSRSLRPVLERAFRERQSKYVLDTPADGIWAQLQIVAAHAFGGPKTPKGHCPEGMGLGPHTLRHTAATLMARDGVPLFAIAGVLGNTVQMVERVYAHQVPADPTTSVDRISKGLLLPPQ